MTLNNKESPSDMADLVEYAYGDAVETALGRQRAADMPAHPHPFQPFIVSRHDIAAIWVAFFS